MNLKYLRKLRPILNKVGKKHGIPVEEGEFIIGNFFKSFKNALIDPRIPKVMLPMFGTFQPKIKYIYRSLRASIRFHKKGGTTRGYMNARIERLWPIRNRLIKEQSQGITWKEWRGKKVKEKFQKLVENEQRQKEESRKEVYGPDNNLEKSRRVFGEIQTGVRAKGGKGRES